MSVSVDFYGPVVYLTDGLDLQVVPKHLVHPFPPQVFCEILCHKLRVVVSLFFLRCPGQINQIAPWKNSHHCTRAMVPCSPYSDALLHHASRNRHRPDPLFFLKKKYERRGERGLENGPSLGEECSPTALNKQFPSPAIRLIRKPLLLSCSSKAVSSYGRVALSWTVACSSKTRPPLSVAHEASPSLSSSLLCTPSVVSSLRGLLLSRCLCWGEVGAGRVEPTGWSLEEEGSVVATSSSSPSEESYILVGLCTHTNERKPRSGFYYGILFPIEFDKKT